MRSATQPYCNTVVSHCACDFPPKFWNDKMNFTRVFLAISLQRPWDQGWMEGGLFLGHPTDLMKVWITQWKIHFRVPLSYTNLSQITLFIHC